MAISSVPKTNAPPPGTAGISVRDLSVHYGNFEALKDVNLSIEAGLVTALVGPSGCGKSSFLHSLNRLTDLVPGCKVKGSVRFGNGGESCGPGVDVLALRRRVGMVFQKPNPFPQSIRRNFEIPLREHGVRRKEISEVIEKCLRDVGLWDEVSDRLDRSAMALSGGQQQRLCIARALALDPDVILFDEPCSALDPMASAVVEEHIAALRGRITVAIVTHNLAQARRISDRVAVFWIRNGSGTIIEHGPTKEVFSNPVDPSSRCYLEGGCG
ncbi:MAG: phosphate ABC transporter ATP-binding protein [Verrucomicrobiales bacterium]|nr:phosphate ABC transporter ATP-binding protein [Verrucomicrobiales bacterium]